MNADHPNADHLTTTMPVPEFLNFGVGQVAYMRPMVVMGKTVWAVHAADGTPISVFNTEDQARQAAAQGDMDLVRVQ
jgi:hypothetical protein